MSGKKFAPTEIDMRLGEMICLMRKKMGYSQKYLAQQVGITFQQIQKYECGENRISVSRLYEIARAMQIPVGRFFNEIDDGCLIDGQTAKIIKQIYRMSEKKRKNIFGLIQALGE